jgi:hypothetical protein
MLRERCEDLPEPQRFLLDAVEMVWQNTGCVWLDADYEQPIDASWNRTDIDWLVKEYAEYEQILGRVGKFMEWVEADPLRMLWTISFCWECMEPSGRDQN